MPEPQPRIRTVDIDLPGAGYAVHIGPGLLSDKALWTRCLSPGKLLLVSDENVAPLYAESLLNAVQGRHAESLVLPAGEAQKTFDGWRTVTDRLVETGALRDATLVALGGGVVGDLAGFAAATYMRGIRYIQAPTTLLAQVDASVGGKTAINHPAGKNLVGAFHQPAAVIIDSDTLASLPAREFSAGLAEVVKYGVIRDRAFFSWLRERTQEINARDRENLLEMIARSVRHKAEVVSEDEKERGVRALLNFGHSFGHALETLTAFSKYLHGEAVAIGMVIAATLSEQRGMCPDGCSEAIEKLLEGFGLPVHWPQELTAEDAIEAMAMDKKALVSGLRLILIEDIGKAVIDPGCSRRDIVRAIESRIDRR